MSFKLLQIFLILSLLYPLPIATAEGIIPPQNYAVQIRSFQFVGNSAVTDRELTALLKDYTGRNVTVDKIYEAKKLITQLYVARGYVNSGAVLPDQDISGGVVTFQIVEGRLSNVIVDDESRFHPAYIEGRIKKYAGRPLHFPSLQLPLYFLHADPSIHRVNAELQPTDQVGYGAVSLKLEETNPVFVSFGISNHKSPTVGDLHRYVNMELRNLTGWNEVTSINYGNTNGLRDYGLSFAIPVNYHDTKLILSYQDSSSTIINDIFKDLDIDSESRQVDMGFRHPLYRTYDSELALSLKLVLKRNETTLLNYPYQYTAELDDGISRRTILSFGQEWIKRSSKQAFTARSTFDISTPWLGATVVNHPADGEFTSWLGQIQWLRRLPFLHSQLLVKTNLRLTDDEVPPSEKFAVGGYSTVRGYRENELTGDQGFSSSVELQMVMTNFKCPGLSDGPEDGDFYLIPFFDFGKVWNKTFDIHNTDIASVGLGIRWIPKKNSRIELFWGHALRELSQYDEYSLQDDGIHFNINLSF